MRLLSVLFFGLLSFTAIGNATDFSKDANVSKGMLIRVDPWGNREIFPLPEAANVTNNQQADWVARKTLNKKSQYVQKGNGRIQGPSDCCYYYPYYSYSYYPYNYYYSYNYYSTPYYYYPYYSYYNYGYNYYYYYGWW